MSRRRRDCRRCGEPIKDHSLSRLCRACRRERQGCRPVDDFVGNEKLYWLKLSYGFRLERQL